MTNNKSSDNLSDDDVPSPIDFRRTDHAVLWAKESNIKRSVRYVFDVIATVIKNRNETDTKVLELGAGPGFLAEYLFSKIPNLSYDLFDFSPAMHELSSQRLALWKNKCNWLTGDFRQSGWSTQLEQYDVVVTMQAVHELRHKRYATEFHKSV